MLAVAGEAPCFVCAPCNHAPLGDPMQEKFRFLSNSVRFSYLVIFSTLVLAAALHLTTPFITILFCYLVLNTLCWRDRKWLAVLVFVFLCAGLFSGFGFFLKQASKVLPEIVSTSIPQLVEYADKHNIYLPFSDMDSLKSVALENVKGALSSVGNFAKLATKEFIFLLMGLVISIGVFLNPDIDRKPQGSEDREGESELYSRWTKAIQDRFRSFYHCFKQVMYAQITISAINTTLTAMFVIGAGLKYASLVVVLTFIFGMLPIIGNIISNTIIVGIAFTSSPGLAISAIIFLVVIHKLEYFLNSKIIGDRIRHPMWLMLLGLIIGERLMGIPGIILAPVILSFIKIEAGRIDRSTTEPVPEFETVNQ